MSTNYRKNIDTYSVRVDPKLKGMHTPWVYRPRSMRKVNAIAELNRMLTLLEAKHKEIQELKQLLQEPQESEPTDSQS